MANDDRHARRGRGTRFGRLALTPQLPADFEAFWREALDQALSSPLEFERNPGNAFDLEGFTVQTYSFRGAADEPRYGWIAVPRGAGRFPSFLWLPPYGRESLLPNEYGTREGFVSASLNFFGHGAFHQEKYIPARGYFAVGVLDPRTWAMRAMFQDAVTAARILREQPEVDVGSVSVMGMSQGGGIALWLATWVEWIRAACADMPFLGGVSQTLGAHVYRYPLKELIDLANSTPGGLERIKATISYFDTVNIASCCGKPVQISLGEKDPAVKPASALAVYEALQGKKRLFRYPTGHDWFPEMVPNNREWLIENGH